MTEIFVGSISASLKIKPIQCEYTGNNNCGLDCLRYYGVVKASQYKKIRKVLEIPNGVMIDLETLVKVCNMHKEKPNIICISAGLSEMNTRISYNKNSNVNIAILHLADHYIPINFDMDNFNESIKQSGEDFHKVVKKIIKKRLI